MAKQQDDNIVKVPREEYLHLIRLKNYVNNWCRDYYQCKKCGHYNPIGNICIFCGKDNS